MFGINLVAIINKIDLQHGSISQVRTVNMSPNIWGYKSTSLTQNMKTLRLAIL